MPVEKLLIHRYANLEISVSGLFRFCNEQNIISVSNYITLRDKPDVKLFNTPTSMEAYRREDEIANPFTKDARSKENIRLTTENDLAGIRQHISWVQNILTQCSAGFFPFIELAGLFKKYVSLDALASSPISGEHWGLQLCTTDNVNNRLIPIEDLIEIIGLLLPLHTTSNPDLKLEWTKRCVVCGNFYQAKGRKANFCSEKCRSHARYKPKSKRIA